MRVLHKKLTFPEFKESTYQMIKLSLWFVWHWKQTNPDETIENILRNRVDIFRKTTLYKSGMDADNPPYDNSVWIDFENAISKIHSATSRDNDAFVEKSFKIFKQSIDKALETRWIDFQKPINMKCGSLNYNETDKKNPSMIAVHIANALAPESIFDDPLYLPSCLIDFMNKTERKFGVDTIHCGSWLNSHPRWLNLFPEEYRNSLSKPDENIQWHLGFWGQFIDARGGFHKRNAVKFRETGKMPFAFRTSECSFALLRKTCSYCNK